LTGIRLSSARLPEQPGRRFVSSGTTLHEAQKLMRERQVLDDGINGVRRIEQSLADNLELIEMGEAEGDKSIVDDAEASIKAMAGEVRERQIETMLSGEADGNDTYLEIHAGAGGTESQDWANMLLRMYTRWAERRGFKVEVLEMHDGEEAGIKSATVLVKGSNAYGWLKTESGRAPAGPHLAL
jgi:peptide chain release factor 2